MTATEDVAAGSTAEPTGSPSAEPGVLSILRRAVRASPELRSGLGTTIALMVVLAGGRLVVPIALQQVLDRGVSGSGGFRPGVVVVICAIALVAVVATALIYRHTYRRLVRMAEDTLYGLRTRTFDHVHRLSVAAHTESKRGVLVSRVTSDIETIAQFVQWGAISWIVNLAVISTVLVVLAIYSWQIALVVIVVFAPVAPLLRWVQRHQIRAYDAVRTSVGDTLGEISEAVMGAPVIRAYGIEARARRRLYRAIATQYRSQMRAAWYFALMFPLADVFGAVALGAVVGIGSWWGPGWGLDRGALVACLLLTTLLLQPIGEIGEILDQTQTAAAGWRKVLDLLDERIEVVEPVPGLDLPHGALDVVVEGVSFAYHDGETVLREVSLELPAGANVAIVGETGSGKTTFAKLLVRLADPTAGSITIGGLALREVAAESRSRSVRMVPQDGFLFSGTVAHNIALGAPGGSADRAAVEAAVAELGLDAWVARLAAGLDTDVGERGEHLSVGERQLVALARAQLADPGLLVLDEATSAVDPETERSLSRALVRLAEGRTTISVAHRLSTAEAADLVVVFDAGRIVEVGHHAELVAAGGRYAALHESWVGNTRVAPGPDVRGATTPQ